MVSVLILGIHLFTRLWLVYSLHFHSAVALIKEMLRKWQKKFILLTISARNQSKTEAEASQRRPCFLFGHEDYVAVKALGGECYQIKSKYNPYSCFGSHSKKCEKCQIQLLFWILYQKAQKSIGKRFDENRKPINTLCKKISFSLVSFIRGRAPKAQGKGSNFFSAEGVLIFQNRGGQGEGPFKNFLSNFKW